MQVGYIQVFDKIICVVKIVLGFARKTNNYISSNASIRHQFFYAVHPAGKYFAQVFAFHQLQNFIAAALQRDVKMWKQFFGNGNQFDNIVV